MFPLHDRTRRMVCRLIFLAVAVLPTCAVAAWCARWNSASPRLELQRELQSRLGLRVAIGSVRQPSPGMLLAEEIELLDPESGELIAKARSIEIRANDGGTATAIFSQPEVQALRLTRLWEAIDRQLRSANNGETASAVLRLGANELTLHWPDQSRTFTEVRAQLGSSPSSAEALLSFQVAGADKAEPARMRVVRNRQSSPPAVAAEMHSADAWLPCQLLLDSLGLKNRLGPDSHFRGSLWTVVSPEHSKVDLSGHFRQVDMHRLVTDQFPHRLGGQAELTVEARFVDGRLQEAVGEIAAGPGVVSRSLLESAHLHLHMPVANNLPFRGDLLAYDQLAAAFVVDVAGMSIRGKCQQMQAGTVLVSGGQEAVLQPPAATSVLNLVRALVPQTEVLTPATTATDWLNPLLPLPAATLPENTPAPTPAGHLRLATPGRARS